MVEGERVEDVGGLRKNVFILYIALRLRLLTV